MKRTFLLLAVSIAACGTRPEGPQPAPSGAPSAVASAREESKAPPAAAVREGSAIARAPQNDALFIADEDREVVHALALPLEVRSPPVDVHVPGRPAQLLVLRDRVLVTIRQVGDGDGALLVLRRGAGRALEEAGRVPLPADAWGIAVGPDEKTAIVSSAWTHQLSAVDLESLRVKWSIDVAREPRGVVVLPAGDRAYVSHVVGSGVTRVDGVSGDKPEVKRIELPAAPLLSPANAKLPASLGYAALASPDGARVYFPRHALGALGPDAWFGVGTVDVLVTADDSELAPPRAWRPTASFVSTVSERIELDGWFKRTSALPILQEKWPTVNAINAPHAAVYRKRTNTILVANEATDSVVELDARAMAPTLARSRKYSTAGKNDKTGVPERGGTPWGIALSEDESKAFVFCRTTHDVVILELPPGDGGYQTAPAAAIPLVAGEDDGATRIGKYLFHGATNATVSGGLSCASCHPEGRDDGHTWHEAHVNLDDPSAGGGPGGKAAFTNFFAGTDTSVIAARWGELKIDGEGGFGYARQTPGLAGRLTAVGPYGWHGESPDLISRIVAGFGLHRWMLDETSDGTKRVIAGHIAKFVREGLVAPPRAKRALTEEEERGRQIFMSPASKCATCHAPQTDYTDHNVTQLKALRPPSGFSEDPNKVYKVPSLLGVGQSPPYMHDGRFESLESLIEYNQDRMGNTSQLSPDERKALIAFLRTI